MMKLASSMALVLAIGVLPAVSSARLGHHPAGRGHHAAGRGQHHGHPLPLFVFGDQFADNGNLPRRDERWPELARQWYFPTPAAAGSPTSTSRQDFPRYVTSTNSSPSLFRAPAMHALLLIFLRFFDEAKILGHAESLTAARAGSSRPHSQRQNFCGRRIRRLHRPARSAHPRAKQVDSLFSLAQAGHVDTENSAALIAVSGNDYARVTADTTAFADVALLVDNVTADIAATAKRLRSIGVRLVLVNNMHPMGCAPSLSRSTNYNACDELANQAASLHNERLAEKLSATLVQKETFAMEGILLLDVNSAFNAVVKHHADGSGEVAHFFLHKLTPCCQSLSPGGYCGERNDSSNDLYTLWDDPDDQSHTGKVGGGMAQLQNAVKKFLH
ncbi:hypothetical protein ACQ4PT_050074 [Festuca glaucescens]